jgi:hypothetical protein
MSEPNDAHIPLANYVVRRYDKFITKNDYHCVVMSSFEETQKLSFYLISPDTKQAIQSQLIFTQIFAGK